MVMQFPMKHASVMDRSDGSSMVLVHAEGAVYEATTDFETEVRDARSVQEVLDIRHRVADCIKSLQAVETLAMERADGLCVWERR